MSVGTLVNLLNLSVTFVTFIFAFASFSLFIVYRRMIKDKVVLFSSLFINLLLLVYSIMSFYIFYSVGFFEQLIDELIYFKHDFLAIIIIIPVIVISVRNWKNIPKILIAIYLLLNISNGIFLSIGNNFVSLIHVFLILLSGVSISMYSIYSKSHSKHHTLNRILDIVLKR